jgi:hypothetical protein
MKQEDARKQGIRYASRCRKTGEVRYAGRRRKTEKSGTQVDAGKRKSMAQVEVGKQKSVAQVEAGNQEESWGRSNGNAE